MFGKLFTRKKHGRSSPDLAHDIYGSVVAKARNKALYQTLLVPDSINGRFDMMVLHIFILSHRLKDQDNACRSLSQSVFDAFLLDMDRGLREEGVGDTTVPKRLKTMTQVFYGRVRAYEGAVESGDRIALAEAINRNVFAGNHDDINADCLAGYTLRLHNHLKALSNQTLLQGELSLDHVNPLVAD